MPDYPDTHSLPYLPVEVSSRIFAIPMSDVAAVHRLSSRKVSAPEPADQEQAIIDLRQLFFPLNRHSTRRPAYRVDITIPGLTYGVLVDDVKLERQADPADQLPMPSLLTGRRYPFSGVVRERGSLVLVIHCRLLAEKLSQVKPDVFLERPHGS